MKKIFLLSLALILIFPCIFSCAPAERAYSVSEYRTTMQFYEDFKILQLTDLHFGIESDLALQLEIVKKAINAEKPDLIILTGDSFMYSSKGVVDSLFYTLNEECKAITAERGRLTKFTFTFGNHDNQGDYSRYYINSSLLSYATKDGDEIKDGKFAAFVDFEDDNLFGLTNFYIDLVDDRTKSAETVDVKYRLHIIDSNSYHFVGPDYDYDVIHEEQLEHAVNIRENATADRDYIGMAFFHIPLYEYEDAYAQFENANSGQGKFNEGVLYGYENNGAYTKLRSAGIVAFFCGHDHINYGDFIYSDHTKDVPDAAILSYGVKSTNQLYHDKEMMGYKTVTLKGDMTVEEFVSMQNISENFKNVTGGYANYEN